MSETSPEALSRTVFWLLVIGAVGFVLGIVVLMFVMPETPDQPIPPGSVAANTGNR